MTIVVDGENAWENYDNDGKEFLQRPLQKALKVICSKRSLPQNTSSFTPNSVSWMSSSGAWFSANYDTWIGESEEAEGWDLLARVRADLKQYVDGTLSASRSLAEAQTLCIGEGSDWFWWYGTDRIPGRTATLMKVTARSLKVSTPPWGMNILLSGYSCDSTAASQG